MKEKNKNLLQSEDAQSTVIGFVLIIGILIATSSIYFAIQVPEWTEDHEALHTAEVADDLSELKALIDGIVLKKGESELAGGAIPIKMVPDKVPIFGMSPPGSNLIVNPQDETIELGVPTAGGDGGSGTWEQNATTGFPYKVAYQVDNSSNEVKLAKYTPEGDLELNGTTAWLDGVRNYNAVIIENGGTLYVAGILKLHANSIFVDSNSEINADGKGYSGGTADSDGDGQGLGKAGAASSGGGGAGYGGKGGDGGGNSGSGGSAYGDPPSSIYAGSGGGGGGSGSKIGGDGGNGGGAILLDAEQINIAGTISANGKLGQPTDTGNAGGGGGGAGGCILIRGKNVTLSGTLSANGGNGGDGKGGGGGGGSGRIKIFYDGENGFLSDSLADYSLDSGAGGTGNPNDGSPGENCGKTEESSPYTSSITHYSSGHFISEIYNTTSDSVCYGEMTWDATLNDQTLVMKVRTDMFDDMRASPDWAYCPAVSNGQDISGLSSVSDGHRYVQYCAELSTDDTATTPVLSEVKINYSLSAESPTVANSSGSIKFQSNYLYYPNQEIVYEHGAVIKYQREGGIILQPPLIEITKNEVSGIPEIGISTVDLTGANYSYSGATTTSVKNSYKSYTLLADCLKYPDLTINLTTDYPSVWGNWFNTTLEESGLDASYYDVNVTDVSVEVKFYGKGDGVELYFEKTVVEVEI